MISMVAGLLQTVGWHHGAIPVIWRGVGAGFTSMVLSWLTGRMWIDYMRQKQWGQCVRDDGPQSHLNKTGTPTMGGVLIVATTTVAMMLWMHWSEPMTVLLWGVMLGFAGIGLCDDLLKLKRQDSGGLSARQKILMMSILTMVVLAVLASWPGATSHVMRLQLPFTAHEWALGGWFFLWGYIVVVGSSNAVNLTDGLDGLAIFPVALVTLALGAVAFHMIGGGHAWHGHWHALVVFSGALAGACLGFLWFNAHPAEIFMGDVGSLSLGALLGFMALVLGQSLLLCILGGVFVLETLSVILQVASFQLTGRRVIKMAPLHHHFELCGWSETKVVCRFWLLTMVLVVIGLSAIPWGN